MKKRTNHTRVWSNGDLYRNYVSFCASKGYKLTEDSKMEFLITGLNRQNEEEGQQLLIREIYSIISSWKHKLGYQLSDCSMEYEDLVMCFVLDIMDGVKKLNYTCSKTSFKGYLYTVFRNYFLDYLRKEETGIRSTNNVKKRIDMENLNQLPESVEEYLNVKQVKNLMESFCRDEDMLLVFEMIYVNGNTIKEVVNNTGYSQATVYRINNRINEFLRSNIVKDRITLLFNN